MSAFSRPSRPSRDADWPPAPTFISRNSVNSIDSGMLLPPPTDSISSDMIFKPPSRSEPPSTSEPPEDTVMSGGQAGQLTTSSLPPMPSIRTSSKRSAPEPPASTMFHVEREDVPRGSMNESPQLSPGGIRRSSFPELPSLSKAIPATFGHMLRASQQNTGDSAGGTERPRNVVQPASLGRADDAAGVGTTTVDPAVKDVLQDAGGVGSMRADFGEVKDLVSVKKSWMPMDDSSFLGTTSSAAESPVVIYDGFGSKVPVDRFHERAFPIQLDSTGTFKWTTQNVPQTTQISWLEANWIVASHPAESQQISFLFYMRSPWLPTGLKHLGSEVVPLASDGPIIIQDSSGKEVTVRRGQDRVLMVGLDRHLCFSWHCDSREQRIHAPSRDVTWVHAEYPQEGQDVRWTFYGTVAKRKLPKALSDGAQGIPGMLSRGKASLPDRQDAEEAVEYVASQGFRCCRDFPLCSVYCPGTFACLVIMFTLVLVGVLWPGMEIDTSFDTFLEADSQANAVRAAFHKALGARGHSRRLADTGLPSPRQLGVIVGDQHIGYDFLDASLLHKINKLEIMYRAKDDGDMMKHLDDVQEIELGLRSAPGWKKMCIDLGNPVLKKLCDPGGSLVNLRWPVGADSNTGKAPFAEYNFTGRGRDPLPLEATLVVADMFNMKQGLFPKSYTGGYRSPELRSLFEFDLVVSYIEDPMSQRREKLREVDEAYEAFVAEELYPSLLKYANEFRKDFDIYWTGSVIGGHETWTTLMADSSLAIGSFAFILFYLTFHTRSPLLSAASLFLVIICIPAAFVSSAILSGGNRVTGASFLSLFLLVGLGADVVLVFVNFWQLSKEVHEDFDYPERIKFTYRTAGLACLATSATTAASFFANLASVLKPLREFGFFMGLCIMLAYSFILIGLPPILILNEKLTRCVLVQADALGFGGLLGNVHGASEGDLPLNSPVHSEASAGGTVRIRHTNSIFSQLLAVYIEHFLVPFSKVVLAAFVLMPIIFIIWTGAVVEVDGGMPQMFPKDHNLYAGKQVQSLFEQVDEMWVRDTAHVCNLGRETPSRSDFQRKLCALFWCQIGVGREAGLTIAGEAEDNGKSVCSCMPTDEPTNLNRCRNVSRDPETLAVMPLSVPAEVRFIGPAHIPAAFWDSQEWKDHVLEAFQAQTESHFNTASVQADASSSYSFTTLVQEHWESGTILVSPFIHGALTDITIQAEDLQGRLEMQTCGPSEICYCGTPVCKFRDESILGPSSGQGRAIRLEIPGDRRLDYLNRRLKDSHHAVDIATASNQSLAHPMPSHVFHEPAFGRQLAEAKLGVALVWGIDVIGGSKLLGDLDEDEIWSYSDTFRPDGPAAQRQLYKACTMDDPALRIVRGNCWIKEFRDWLIMRGELFPVRAAQFDNRLDHFARTGLLASGNAISDFMWFDDTSKMRATFVEFTCNVNGNKMPAARALEYKDVWDKTIEKLNDDGPEDANEAWHTSSLWIRAEAEKAIVDSTLATLLISIGCGFLGAIVFTHLNIILSLFVVMSVGGVTACLAFFMTGVMGWAIGAVEVLGLIVFVGYSITYSLHIAHKYAEHMKKTEGKFHIRQRREYAASHALKQMTSSVLGSALTTLGSSFFLFFCTMGIFVKLASVLFAVTVFAEVFALCGLPSALIVVGPRALMCFGFLGDPEAEWTGREESSEYQSHGGIEETQHEEEPDSPKSTTKSEVSQVYRSNPQYSPAASPVPSAASAMHAPPRVTFGETQVRLHMSAAEAFMPSRPRFNTGTSTGSGGSDDASSSQAMDPQLTAKTHAPFGSLPPTRERASSTATAPASIRRAE